MQFSLLFGFIFYFIASNIIYAYEEREVVKILGLFDESETEVEAAFQIAVRRVNKDPRLLPRGIILEPVIQHVDDYDSLKTSKIICNAIQEGIAAIFGPQSNENRNIAESICQYFDIPHIEAFWDPNTYAGVRGGGVHGVNVYPTPSLISKGISDIRKDTDWSTFTVIYEEHDNLIHLQKVLEYAHDVNEEVDKTPGRYIVVRQLPPNTMDFRPLLKEIKDCSESHILIDASVEKTIELLRQAKEIGLMGVYQNYILTNLNSHTGNFEGIHNGLANVTTVRMINPTYPTIKSIISGWNYEEKEMQELGLIANTLNISPENVQVESALMYDAVYLFATALTGLAIEKPLPRNVSCEKKSSPWEYGLGITNLMKAMVSDGLTGRVKLTEDGRRDSFSIEYVELVNTGWKVLATWSDHGLNHTRSVAQMDREQLERLENRTLVVTSKIGDPYLSQDPVTGELSGYTKDIIDMIARDLNFTTKIELEKNGVYGSLNPKTGKWNGLIGELHEQRADLAICDLTITAERRSAVDFTMPFMTLGISILYRKPDPPQPDLFSFLSPLSFDVWIYMATAYLGVSLLLFFLARCTPYEWESPHPCDSDPEELENVLSLVNCLWFSLGSVLAQGCDILPKAVSTRLVAGMWWFFTLIMISSYTANLAAFLTNTRMNPPISNVEDLAKSTIKYGCVKDGSTYKFFKTSNDTLYQKMYSNMEQARPTVYVKSNKEGVDRVKRDKGKYAFFMESTGIEYEIEKNCDLMQVGGLLDSKGYGIATPFFSPHRKSVSTAVLKLQESGALRTLKELHWKKNGSQCAKDDGETSDAELGIQNVGGVFVVLIAGCCISLCFAILEFLWNVRKVAVQEKLSPYEAFLLELKFAMKCRGSSKPVKRKSSSASDIQNATSFEKLELFNNRFNNRSNHSED